MDKIKEDKTMRDKTKRKGSVKFQQTKSDVKMSN